MMQLQEKIYLINQKQLYLATYCGSQKTDQYL
jgi:hypothetical protein